MKTVIFACVHNAGRSQMAAHSVRPRRVDSGRNGRYDFGGVGKRAEQCARASGDDGCHQRQGGKTRSQNLLDIAGATWKNNREADAKKRTSVAASLRERLRWKMFDEIP